MTFLFVKFLFFFHVLLRTGYPPPLDVLTSYSYIFITVYVITFHTRLSSSRVLIIWVQFLALRIKWPLPGWGDKKKNILIPFRTNQSSFIYQNTRNSLVIKINYYLLFYFIEFCFTWFWDNLLKALWALELQLQSRHTICEVLPGTVGGVTPGASCVLDTHHANWAILLVFNF